MVPLPEAPGRYSSQAVHRIGGEHASAGAWVGQDGLRRRAGHSSVSSEAYIIDQIGVLLHGVRQYE